MVNIVKCLLFIILYSITLNLSCRSFHTISTDSPVFANSINPESVCNVDETRKVLQDSSNIEDFKGSLICSITTLDETWFSDKTSKILVTIENKSDSDIYITAFPQARLEKQLNNKFISDSERLDFIKINSYAGYNYPKPLFENKLVKKGEMLKKVILAHDFVWMRLIQSIITFDKNLFKIVEPNNYNFYLIINFNISNKADNNSSKTANKHSVKTNEVSVEIVKGKK